ncbi:MAG TPA: DUF3795 domain-containing protein [Candidatus Acetothermia bacterium]|nr:DUF3795 domain-containing protein [Candidatus Acetothermia bacterium]
MEKMEKMIAYCGLVCTECPAYIATQADDREQLVKVAAQWSVEYDATLTADDCVCDGCLATTDRHIGHWDECKIRVCASDKKVRNCAHCTDYPCSELKGLFSFAPHAQAALDQIRQNL